MRILFVCVQNTCRSQMAEAYLNHFARERGIEVIAESAGTKGSGELNPLVVEVMAKEEISLDGQEPKLLTQEMVDRADKVISMGCGVDAAACPARFIVSEDWELEDPHEKPIEFVRQTRDAIRIRVEKLLEHVL